MSEPRSFILYDGDCPVCSNWIAMSRLRKIDKGVAVLDARQHPDLVAKFRSQGREINKGMIVQLPDRTLYGAVAMQFIAAAGVPSGVVSRAILATFRLDKVRVIYPVLVFLRGILLRLLGKPLIP